MQRQEGYYWVKFKYSDKEVIAEWLYGVWYICGEKYDRGEKEIEYIGHRIPSNEEIENIQYLKETIRKLEQEMSK